MGNGAVLWQKISILPGIQRCPAGLAFIVKVESWKLKYWMFCFRAQLSARRSPAARWAGVWTADCWRTEPWRWRIAVRWGSVCLLKWIPLEFFQRPAAYLLTYHFGAIYMLKIDFFMLFWGLPLIYHSWQPCNLITATPLMTDNWSWYFYSRMLVTHLRPASPTCSPCSARCGRRTKGDGWVFYHVIITIIVITTL